MITGDGKISAIGQEAEAAGRRPGMQLMRFPDVATAWQQQELAAALFRYYWMTLEFRGRSTWRVLASRLLPSLRSLLVVHPAEGAERGLAEGQAGWLRAAFRQPRRTFVWTGERLDPVARLRHANQRGRWIGGQPAKL